MFQSCAIYCLFVRRMYCVTSVTRVDDICLDNTDDVGDDDDNDTAAVHDVMLSSCSEFSLPLGGRVHMHTATADPQVEHLLVDVDVCSKKNVTTLLMIN